MKTDVTTALSPTIYGSTLGLGIINNVMPNGAKTLSSFF